VTYINSDSASEPTWASRLGAFSPRPVSFPGISAPIGVSGTAVSGTGVSGTGVSGTGPCTAVVHAVPRVKGKFSVLAPMTQSDAVATLLGQTNIHNYMTRAYAAGEGASGPPPSREPV
jgi:hypothetical protein